MATFTFDLPIYGYDQFTITGISNGLLNNATVSFPNGSTFTLNANPTLQVVEVEDDDGAGPNLFDDGFIDEPGDGSNPSTANNDQLLTQGVTINGQSFSAGDQVELEFLFTAEFGTPTQTGDFFVIRIDGDNVGISGPVLPQPGVTLTITGSSDGSFTPIEDIPCFLEGTLIETSKGQRPVETLATGDLVLTQDRDYQPIRWINRRTLTAAELARRPNLRPVTIARGALGKNLPQDALSVSPQHRILVRSPIAKRMFKTSDVLVAAKKLLPLKGVSSDERLDSVTYVHFMFERHEVVFANGAPTESLFAGPQAIAAMPEEARQELFEIFPDLDSVQQVPAAVIPAGKRQKRLVERHHWNGQPLVADL